MTANPISRRLRTRLMLFIGIGAAIALFIAYDVFQGVLPWYMGLFALLIGAIIGYFLGRIRTVRIHPDTQEVVSEMDIVGGIAIALYIIFDLSREWIFGHWLQGPELSAFTLAILSGALFGRYLGMRRSIDRVLGTVLAE